MKLDEHKKQELTARHMQWLQDPVTIAMFEIIARQQQLIAAQTAGLAFDKNTSDSFVRVYAGQYSAWTTIEHVIKDTGTFINNLANKQ